MRTGALLRFLDRAAKLPRSGFARRSGASGGSHQASRPGFPRALHRVRSASVVAGLLALLLGCTDDSPSAPTAEALAPLTIIDISPNQGVRDGGTRVTILGTGFKVGASVAFGAIDAIVVRVVSNHMIIAIVPAYTGRNLPADIDVTVWNPDGEGYRRPAAFTYFEPGDACMGCWDY